MIKHLLTLLPVLLSGCFLFDPVLNPDVYYKEKARTYEYALNGEYNKVIGHTEKHNLKVFYPRWLAADDHCRYNAVVDSYLTEMIKAYPPAGKYDWSVVWMYGHDAISEKIVSAGSMLRIWCYGWRQGRFVFCPWRPILDENKVRIGIATTDILMVLPHELTHILCQWETGGTDPQHTGYFKRPEIINMINSARKNVISITLTEESKTEGMKFEYIPWMIPK